MIMKKLLLTLTVAICGITAHAQGVSAFCDQAENICSQNGSNFPLTTTGANAGLNGLPFSNPGFGSGPNTGNPNSAGCLNSGGPNPNWFVINVASNGTLEFSIGAAGGTGFYDWALWPYYDNGPGNTACDAIYGNTLAPVACNWNASSAGFTGMAPAGNLPPGANQGNFEFSLNVTAGQQYILCFSNFSFQAGNAQLTFGSGPGSAAITCQPGTPDQDICLGSSATVDIVIPPTVNNPSFNWLITTGVSNTTGGTNVTVTPTQTTEYHVEIMENGVVFAIDTFTINVVPPPTPDAGPDQVVCLGTPIQLNAVQSDPTNTFLWLSDVSAVTPAPNVNYVPNSNVTNPLVSVNQTGTYLFIAREGNALCGNVFDTMEVIVEQVDIAAVDVSPSCIGFADGEIHITSPQAVEYSFDGGTTYQLDSFNITMPAGTHTVCARSALGCEECIDIDVIDPPAVLISVSNDTIVCENGTANLLASGSGGAGAPFTYTWGHSPATGDASDVNPTIPSVYTVFVADANGCVSATENINVDLYPPLSGNISPNDTICPGYPTDIWANCSGGIGQPYTFTWSTTDTQTGPDNHQFSVNPPQTTTYTVTVNDGCETTPWTTTTEVFVAPLPVPDYEVLDPEQCEPAVFHIVNRTDPALSEFVYWWVEPSMQFLNQDTIVTDTLMAGYYDLQMIVTTDQGCIDSLTFIDALHVKGQPKADLKHAPNPVLMFNTNVLFTNYSVGATSYQWYFEEGTPSSSTLPNNVSVMFPDGQTGTYDVTLIATSELGCIDTMIYELIVFPEVLIYAPNTFTPDGDEFNQTWRVFMEGIDLQDFNLTIYNRWGQLVWETNDISVGWDGTYGQNGRPVQDGAYTWFIRAADALNDSKYEYNGHVNIIR